MVKENYTYDAKVVIARSQTNIMLFIFVYKISVIDMWFSYLFSNIKIITNFSHTQSVKTATTTLRVSR